MYHESSLTWEFRVAAVFEQVRYGGYASAPPLFAAPPPVLGAYGPYVLPPQLQAPYGVYSGMQAPVRD